MNDMDTYQQYVDLIGSVRRANAQLRDKHRLDRVDEELSALGAAVANAVAGVITFKECQQALAEGAVKLALLSPPYCEVTSFIRAHVEEVNKRIESGCECGDDGCGFSLPTNAELN